MTESKRNRRPVFRVLAAVWTAGILGAALPLSAFGASPEFARTEEEWALLRDNRLDYEEIADLIHEYNTTVQNNQYEFNRFVSEYGTEKDDIYNAYMELADELEASMTGDGSGTGLVSDLQLELQARQLRQQADDNLEDSYTYNLTCLQAEDNLALSAKLKFISYYKSQLTLEMETLSLQEAERTLSRTETARQAGTATDSDVLSAREQVLNGQKAVEEAKMEAESTRQSLIVMLGWQGSDQPEIGAVPQADPAEIEAIDPEADLQEALDNNYTLLINQRKLENADDWDDKKSIENTMEGNRRQIGVSLNSAWQSLSRAKQTLEQAEEKETTAGKDLELARIRYSAGLITAGELEDQQSENKRASLERQTAALELLEALETYRSTVDGLAAAE